MSRVVSPSPGTANTHDDLARQLAEERAKAKRLQEQVQFLSSIDSTKLQALLHFDHARLAAGYQKMRDTARALQDDKNALEDELEGAVAAKAELIMELADTQQQLDNTVRERDAVVADLVLARETNEQLRNKLAEIRGGNTASSSGVDAVSGIASLAGYYASFGGSAASSVHEENNVSTLSAQVRFLRQDSEALKLRVSELVVEAVERDRVIGERDLRIASLEHTIAQTKQQLEEATARVAEEKVATDKLTRQVKSQKSEIDHLNEELRNSWDRAREAMLGEDKQIKEMTSALQSMVKALQNENQALVAERTTLKKAISELHSEHAKCDEQQKASEAEHRRLVAQLEQTQQKLELIRSSQSSEIAFVEREKRSLETALTQSQTRFRELEALACEIRFEKESNDEILESLQVENKSLREKLSSAQAKAARGETAQQNYEERLAEVLALQSQLSVQKQEFNEITHELEKYKNENSMLTTKLAQAQDELQQLQTGVHNVSKIHDQIAQDAELAHEQLQQHADLLQKQLDEASTERDELKAKLGETKALSETLRTHISKVEAKCQRLTLHAEQLRQQLAKTNANQAAAPRAVENTTKDQTPEPANKLIADQFITVEIPPGPIGVKLSKTVPITILELLELSPGNPSPLAGHAQPGDILFSVDGDDCTGIELVELQHRMSKSVSQKRTLVFKRSTRQATPGGQ